ncbi:MAG: peptidoglycan-binding domain-containing protein [bacterium]|nr:peptidoglycan-binding domain-containing protein [bacterium]
MISRKISSLILATATVAAFGGAALIPAISSAQMMSCTFTRSLTVGSRGADVKCLQETLKAGGFLNIASTTMYFGSMTKAAVARWQASVGVAPAVGFFGPLSRAKYAMNGPVVVNPNPNPNPMPVPMSGVMVSLSANQPTGSAIAGAGQLDVAKFTFTASNAAGTTITSMKFIRTGVVSDSNISNLYLADESGVIFAQYSSLNNGVAMFDGVNLQVNAGQSRVVTLRMDLSSSASAGNTLGWQLAMATASNGTVTGTPVTGPSLVVTTVSNPSLATATYTYVATGSTVDAGTNGFRTHSATVNVTNSAVLLKSIKYTVVGSANMSDLKNATLKISGVTVATTSAIASNGVIVFIPTGDVRIPTGNSTFEVYVDVAGSPNRTMAWNILRPYDAVFVDTQYNTPVTPTTSGSATTVTINQGRVTISKATDTPTANIPLGASNVTLAKFNFYAGGEPVKLRFLPITITATRTATTTASTVDVRNISVVDDVGNSVGTTISSGAVYASNAFTADFGTSSSYINYIIPANTTRVLSVKVDVQSDATATGLQAALGTPSAANLEGQISFQTSTSGTASGNTLTIATSPLTAALNPSFASPTYVAGANNMRLASFIFTASSAEGAKISSLTFAKTVNADFDVQNLRVMVGGTQFGTATSIVAATETSLSYSGSNPLIVPAGGSITVDLYGDILTSSTAATHATVFDLSGASAVGSSSNSSITVKAGGVAISTTNVAGQSIIISSGSTVTLTTDSNNVSAKQVVMGSGSNVLYLLKLSANNTEDVRVTDITFRDTIGGGNTAGISSFNNLQLFDDAGTLLAGPVNMTISSATTGDVVFSLGSTSSLIVPKNSSKTITLKGDVATFISGGASSSSSHVFGIAAIADVTAYGKDSSAAATISGTTTGSAQVVYRSKPTLTSSVLGSTTGRTRVAVDDIATLNWAANAADDLTISTVTVKFSGQAASNGGTAFTSDLIDANTNAAWGSATQQTCTPGAGNSCSVSFSPAFSITRGSTKATKLRVNSSAFYNGSNTSDSLSAIINAASDILWSDGTTTGISWESVQIPITLVNLSYEEHRCLARRRSESERSQTENPALERRGFSFGCF